MATRIVFTDKPLQAAAYDPAKYNSTDTNAIKNAINDHATDIEALAAPGTVIPFTTSIPLTRSNTIMGTTLSADITFTEDIVGKLPGAGGTIKLQADGTHTITMPAGWIEQSGSEGFDAATAGMKHRLIYYYDGDDVTYGIEQVVAGVILTTPAAPTLFVVDDTADTGDWTNNPLYTALSDYEYTLNGGSSYAVVTAKPLSVGDVAKAIGQVGVRVKAVPSVSNASATLFNATAYTPSGLITPAAPTLPVTDDTADTFDWTNTPGYTAPSDYEYTLNAGGSYADVTVKPIVVGNIAKAIGQVGVRVKAVPSVSNASGTLYNTVAFLLTPATPTAPVTDDSLDTFDWTYSAGFTTPTDYEWRIGGAGAFTGVTAKPHSVGNISVPVGDFEIRVKAVAGVNTASASLLNAAAFTTGAFPISEDFESTLVGNIPTGWSATAGLAVSAAATINGLQELALPSAAGAKFMAFNGGVSGIATVGTVLLRKLTPAAAGSGGIFLRANSAVPASITDAYVAWLQFGPSPVILIYSIDLATGYTLLHTSPYNPTLTSTDIYTFSYGVDAAHLHTVRVQRSSDNWYMTNIGAWQAAPTDALTHTEGTPAHTSAGHVGFWAGDLPGTADAYADDVSFT